MDSQTCQVYKVELCVPSGNRHSAMYVATEPSSGSGQLLHVRCFVGQAGMMFDRQYFVGHGPESLPTFSARSLIGSVRMEDVERLVNACSGIGAPTVQYVNDICQCTTWVDQAHLAAKEAGILL